ncbi:MAG: glycosyltransferase family 4 protein [Xanthobacteraceae bacterium]|nr:glycosyltransferase family 4 protein [Xanthobacteraceae bacterium]
MKILHTEASPGWGGQEIRVLDEAQGFIERGHQVWIAGQSHSQIVPASRKRGIETYELPFGRVNFPNVRAMITLLKRLDPDIVVTHSRNDTWIAALGILFGGAKAKLIRTRHVSIPVKPGLRNRWLYGRRAARVVTTGEAIRSHLINVLKFDPAHVISIPTGTDLSRYRAGDKAAARAKLNLPADKKLIGMVATLRSWKGHRFMVDALLDKKLGGMNAVFVGDGPQEPLLLQQVAERGLKDRIIFAGRREDVQDWLRAFDVFVLPSTGNEGIPQALMQAMATSLPVVTTPVGAIPELVTHNESGWMVQPENPSSLADGIATVLADPSLAKRLGDTGRIIVEKKHTKAAMLDAMEEVFRKALEA